MADRIGHTAEEGFVLGHLGVVQAHDPLHVLVHREISPTPDTVPQQRRRGGMVGGATGV